MFNKENKLEKFKDAETVIGSSIKVKGNFQGQGDIVIEGSLEGSLKTEANLYIGEKAKVVASVESKDATINGEVKGNIKTRGYLALGSTARIFGDIQYNELSIEKGAVINGQLLMTAETSNRRENKKIEDKNDSEDKE
ncbi:MAG: bactofilin family protein [Patescibacteria group bacterium]